MKTFTNSLVSAAVTAALFLAGCSSSVDSEPGATLSNDMPATAGNSDESVANSGNDPINNAGANSTDLTPTGTGSLNLAIAYPALLNAVAGYQLESLAEEVMLMGDAVSVGSAGMQVSGSGSLTINDRGEDFVTESEAVMYNCAAGGTVTIDQGRLNIAESSYSRSVEVDRYTFEQCATTNSAQMLDGIVDTFNDSTSGNRFQRGQSTTSWSGFSWNQASGQHMSADGSVESNFLSTIDANYVRKVTVNDFSLTRGNRIVEQISNARFTEQSETLANGGIQVYALDINSQVTDSSGIATSISSQPAMSRVWVAHGLESGPRQPEPFSGEINLSADNGGQILLTAVEPGDTSTRRVDVFHRAVDGTTSTKLAQNFQTFDAPR